MKNECSYAMKITGDFFVVLKTKSERGRRKGTQI